jgi:hypothetical protein
MSEWFTCDDKAQLVAYLYDEVDLLTRQRIDEHLRVCPACAREVAELTGVRHELATWQPPDAALGFAVVPSAERAAPPALVAGPARWWQSRTLPPWAQAAAAVLVFAAGTLDRQPADSLWCRPGGGDHGVDDASGAGACRRCRCHPGGGLARPRPTGVRRWPRSNRRSGRRLKRGVRPRLRPRPTRPMRPLVARDRPDHRACGRSHCRERAPAAAGAGAAAHAVRARPRSAAPHRPRAHQPGLRAVRRTCRRGGRPAASDARLHHARLGAAAPVSGRPAWNRRMR